MIEWYLESTNSTALDGLISRRDRYRSRWQLKQHFTFINSQSLRFSSKNDIDWLLGIPCNCYHFTAHYLGNL
jgi:hypothetical protein